MIIILLFFISSTCGARKSPPRAPNTCRDDVTMQPQDNLDLTDERPQLSPVRADSALCFSSAMPTFDSVYMIMHPIGQGAKELTGRGDTRSEHMKGTSVDPVAEPQNQSGSRSVELMPIYMPCNVGRPDEPGYIKESTSTTDTYFPSPVKTRTSPVGPHSPVYDQPVVPSVQASLETFLPTETGDEDGEQNVNVKKAMKPPTKKTNVTLPEQ